MFDIGWQELFIIVVVGIIVIGPKELPRAARAIAGIVRKARMMAHEFQDGVDDMIQQADLEDIKKHVTGSGEDFKNQIKNTVDPDGTIAHDLDLTELDEDLEVYDDDEEDEFSKDKVEQISADPDGSDKTEPEAPDQADQADQAEPAKTVKTPSSRAEG